MTTSRNVPAKFLYQVIDKRAGALAATLPLLSVSISRGVIRRDELTDKEARADDLFSYKLCAERDIVINRMSAYQGALGISPIRGLVSPDYLVLRASPEAEPRFLTYLFRSTRFIGEMTARLRGIGSTEQGNVRTPRINEDELGRIMVGIPAPNAQRAIADYLDRETARIDALIAAKRRMVGLLDERLAIYTRQLMMSGSHPLRPLKRTWQVIDCKHRTPAYTDDGYPVISPGDTTPGRLDISRAHRFVDEDDYRDLTEAGRQPRRGAIVYSRNASIGIASFVDTDSPFCMGQDVCMISSDHASQLYLTYFLNSLGLDQLEAQKLGSTFSRVNIAQILELVVPTPHPDEQHRIARRLDEATSSQQAVVTCLGKQLNLLQERRRAVITAAVTGQLDIAEAA